MAILQAKTKTASKKRQTILRVSSIFARPTKRLIKPQREASVRLKQFHRTEWAIQVHGKTGSKSPSKPDSTTSKVAVETAVPKSESTLKQKSMRHRDPQMIIKRKPTCTHPKPTYTQFF
ncbi:hypothetical protein B0T20DRAFT_397636 [Sordaria brevicollis]|uniref:Uncharacterized protein n=1 Tax=Sordaria brevicollis TaxID=83679 RepID=A0AAE0U2Y9_SORBR|nr:hypothetical protein B0T20DRAFT_397636 [Sordaria brevicollis]